jgi:hypothetical protein
MSSIRSISRIEPGQFALIVGATYVVFGIFAAVLVYLFMSVMPIPGLGGMNMGTGVTVIVLPILYGIFGYIFGFIGALIYNLVAGTVGGIKVTVSE